MLKVKDLKTLRKIKTNNKKDELAIVEETRTIYQWDGANWQVHKTKNGANISLYALNKMAITSFPSLTEDQIQEAKEEIKNFLNPIEHSYYMLLNNELKYYTIFLIGLASTLFNKPEDEIIECLQAQGEIKEITLVENGIECWVTKDNESFVYYLFEYDKGVIKCQ